MNEQNLDLCSEKLKYLSASELKEIIKERITNYCLNKELINFIEDKFTNEDWEWFFEEYVQTKVNP